MASWYVSTAGSDSNDGTTLPTAFLTVQKAHDSATSGDDIIIEAGTYLPPDPTVDAFPVILSTPFLTIISDGGTAVFDGNGTAHSWFRVQAAAFGLLFQGPFEITNTRWGGIVFDYQSSAEETNINAVYCHHIGNRSESSSSPIFGIYGGIDTYLSNIKIQINQCQFSHIGRTNIAADCYDAAVIAVDQLAVINSVFCDSFNSWHFRGLAGFTGSIIGNWFFGANGFPKPGQIMLEGAEAGISISSNVFYDPGSTAIASRNGFSSPSIAIINNQLFTDSGATITSIAGGGIGSNTTGSLADYTGSVPCGSFSGTGTGGSFTASTSPGSGGYPSPGYSLTGTNGLANAQTWTFDRAWFTPSIGGGTSGTWGTNKLIFDMGGFPNTVADAFTFSAGCILPTDTPEVRSLITCDPADGLDAGQGALVYVNNGVPTQIIPSNIDATVEGYPTVNQFNYDSSQGPWERNGMRWVIAALAISQRVVMLGTADDGETWLEYDAANCPGVIPFSWYDGALQPAARPSGDRRYCDVCFNVGDPGSHIALNTFDFVNKTWSGNYGDIDLGTASAVPVDFKPGNSIVRYANGDKGVFYTYPPQGGGIDQSSKLVYREYILGAWSPEYVVVSSTDETWWANFAFDPGTDIVHCSVYLAGIFITAAYYTVSHGGTFSGNLYSFPSPSDSDGMNHPVVSGGFVYFPYDDWTDKANSVYVTAVGDPTGWVKQPLPVPPVTPENSGITESCSFMLRFKAQSSGSYAHARLRFRGVSLHGHALTG